jgi:hypothetical protein
MDVNYNNELIYLNEYLRIFPASQIKDIYKYFMQSYLGPSHFHLDSEKVAISIKEEYEILKNKKYNYPRKILLGNNRNYCRISIFCLNEIRFEEFVESFLQSMKINAPIKITEWLEIWGNISELLLKNNYFSIDIINNFNNVLSENNYVFHHSDVYKNNYNPHYRVFHITKLTFL